MIPNALNVTIGEDVEVQTAAEAPTRTFKIDFDAGRVGGFCDETEAMKQAIYKILQTERFEYLIYWKQTKYFRSAQKRTGQNGFVCKGPP